VASPYIASYILHTADVDKDYGMRRDVDGIFRIGNSAVQIDGNSNVNVQGYVISVPRVYLNYDT